MQLPDVNVLVYAHREDGDRHLEYRRWLEALIGGPAAYGLSEFVLSSFLRIVTNPRIFKVPTPLDRALAFTAVIREQPNCVRLTPGPRHWDAYLAALAIETDSEFITTDRDFAQFSGLRQRHPLDGMAP